MRTLVSTKYRVIGPDGDLRAQFPGVQESEQQVRQLHSVQIRVQSLIQKISHQGLPLRIRQVSESQNSEPPQTRLYRGSHGPLPETFPGHAVEQAQVQRYARTLHSPSSIWRDQENA